MIVFYIRLQMDVYSLGLKKHAVYVNYFSNFIRNDSTRQSNTACLRPVVYLSSFKIPCVWQYVGYNAYTYWNVQIMNFDTNKWQSNQITCVLQHSYTLSCYLNMSKPFVKCIRAQLFTTLYIYNVLFYINFSLVILICLVKRVTCEIEFMDVNNQMWVNNIEIIKQISYCDTKTTYSWNINDLKCRFSCE